MIIPCFATGCAHCSTQFPRWRSSARRPRAMRRLPPRRQRSRQISIVVVTMFEDEESVFAALRAGARGYVLKGASPPEIMRAIGAVANGEAIFSPAIAQRVLDYF